MRRHRIVIIALSVGGFALAMLPFMITRPLIDARLLAVQGFPDALSTNQKHPWPCFIFRLTKPDSPYIEFAQEQVIQYRIGGEWLAAEKYTGPFVSVDPLPECRHVGAIPNRRGAEAFKVYLTYRRGSPRDEADGRLAGSRWAGKVPGWMWELVARLRKERQWRHTAIEFELPKQPWWSAPGYQPAHNDCVKTTPDCATPSTLRQVFGAPDAKH